MTNYIDINRGECLDVELEWKDEDGAAIDLTDAMFSVPESSVPVVATFTVLDAAGGKVTLHIDDTSSLRLGRVDWFRVAMAPAPGACADTTPPIWVRVQ